MRVSSRIGSLVALVCLGLIGMGCAGQASAEPQVPPPAGIAVGADGNIWFSEPEANRIGRITPEGAITEFSKGGGLQPTWISAGPGGNLWFAARVEIGRITTRGVISTVSKGLFPYGTCCGEGESAGLGPLRAGPDGNMWFTAKYGVGRITRAGVVTSFYKQFENAKDPSRTFSTWALAGSTDGNMWFTESSQVGDGVGRITPSGTVTHFSQGITAPVSSTERGIVAGSDGNVWFAGEGAIGRITPAGAITEFKSGFTPDSLLAGPDGNVWFATGRGIGRITPAGMITEFPTGPEPHGLVVGPDGNVWFAEFARGRIGRVTPSGQVTSFAAGITPGRTPTSLAAGADGNVWFTEFDPNLPLVYGSGGIGAVGRITPDGAITEYPPSARIRRVRRGGTVAVVVGLSCPRAAPGRCRGTVRLRAGGSVSGARRIDLAPGQRRQVVVPLPAAWRRQLRQRGHITLSVAVRPLPASTLGASDRRVTFRVAARRTMAVTANLLSPGQIASGRQGE